MFPKEDSQIHNRPSSDNGRSPPPDEGGDMPESTSQSVPSEHSLFTAHRNAPRAFIRLAGWITVGAARSKEHVAFVRDISPRGIFFYSDFGLDDGQYIEFVVEYLKGNNMIRLHLGGHVIRVKRARQRQPSASQWRSIRYMRRFHASELRRDDCSDSLCFAPIDFKVISISASG